MFYTGPNFCLEHNATCSHLCLPRPRKMGRRFSCACPDGFVGLGDDGRTCINRSEFVSIYSAKIKKKCHTEIYIAHQWQPSIQSKKISFIIAENKTNHPILSNSHLLATANKAIHSLKRGVIKPTGTSYNLDKV